MKIRVGRNKKGLRWSIAIMGVHKDFDPSKPLCEVWIWLPLGFFIRLGSWS